MTSPAIVYLNWGRLVADCPTAGCTNAREVQPGENTFVCAGAAGSACGTSAPLQWPDDLAAERAEVGGLPPAQQSRPVHESIEEA